MHTKLLHSKQIIALISLLLFTSCINDEQINSKFVKRKYRTKPSESMQLGINKESVDKNYIIKKDEVEQDKKEYSGIFKIGKPYSAFNILYTPQNYETFEEVGIASWYGKDFHGKKTANGEIYNIDDLTAAHPTLPLPSLVKVTNLQNNKSQILRVNDRGPFSKKRVIDVSEKAADLLGFKQKGTTQVKVELLREETDRMLNMLGLAYE